MLGSFPHAYDSEDDPGFEVRGGANGLKNLEGGVVGVGGSVDLVM